MITHRPDTAAGSAAAISGKVRDATVAASLSANALAGLAPDDSQP
ncbi:MAG: hypothetical protein QOI25_767 [Mycobacterium sp.]|nr:hypothetical protein [Mycobacterium sp.]